MEAIDTLYNGNYFRSRLEARWAYFFDEVEVKYEYEPQGFKSSKGECYLPDFYLPDTYLRHSDNKGIYIEIKPESHTSGHIPAAFWFDRNLVLFEGQPIKNIFTEYCIKNEFGGVELHTDGMDFPMLFWRCWVCEGSKIDFHHRSNDYCPVCHRDEACDPYIETAAKKAMMKRFEHLNL